MEIDPKLEVDDLQDEIGGEGAGNYCPILAIMQLLWWCVFEKITPVTNK
jgi:hypothetical protein